MNFYITTNSDLQTIVNLASAKKIVAIDTEFTREKTYYPILSLIQIAIDNKKFAIDCLSENIDLSPIYGIIADEKIKKILHSSMQDLQIFYQKSKTLPNNIADVQIMSNFCGMGFNIGYSTLVENFFGIKIDKKLQRSNWQRRPLADEQIEYALLDVAYLEEIYFELAKNLKDKKRENWLKEETDLFISQSLSAKDDNLLKKFIAQKKFRHKTQEQIQKIKELLIWREKMAQITDLPRRHFLEDNMLEDMVMMQNFNINLDKEFIEQAKKILEANFKDLEEMDEEFYKNKIMNESQKNLYQKAKNMIVQIAANEGLKEQFLITSDLLKQIILGHKKIDEIKGWRYYLFGRKLEKMICDNS